MPRRRTGTEQGRHDIAGGIADLCIIQAGGHIGQAGVDAVTHLFQALCRRAGLFLAQLLVGGFLHGLCVGRKLRERVVLPYFQAVEADTGIAFVAQHKHVDGLVVIDQTTLIDFALIRAKGIAGERSAHQVHDLGRRIDRIGFPQHQAVGDIERVGAFLPHAGIVKRLGRFQHIEQAFLVVRRLAVFIEILLGVLLVVGIGQVHFGVFLADGSCAGTPGQHQRQQHRKHYF